MVKRLGKLILNRWCALLEQSVLAVLLSQLAIQVVGLAENPAHLIVFEYHREVLFQGHLGGNQAFVFVHRVGFDKWGNAPAQAFKSLVDILFDARRNLCPGGAVNIDRMQQKYARDNGHYQRRSAAQ